MNLIEIGSILHDIGRSITNRIEYGAIGAQLAEILELNEKSFKLYDDILTQKSLKKKGLN